MTIRNYFITSILAITCSAHAQLQQVTPGEDLVKEAPRKGWHFYQDPAEKKQEEPKEVLEIKKPAQQAGQPAVVVVKGKQIDCTKAEQWESRCGFVDPGDDFDFQAKQRDILLQQMSMTPDKPEAVEAAQRYMKWVVKKAAMAANMWYFNMIQKPDLDPTVKSPISEVGIALASKVERASQVEYFKLMKEEGGVLFYFTRHDCQFCHDQAPYTRRVAQTMGLQLINVPLDGKCLEGFKGDDCGDNIKPEQVAPLQVGVVPSIYLHVPSNTWIRLASGVVPDSIVLANTVNFFSAYRAAILNGIDNTDGVRPNVTFDPEMRIQPTGTAPAEGNSAKAELDRGKLLELMGYSNKNSSSSNK